MYPLASADPGDLPNRVREIISICSVAVNQDLRPGARVAMCHEPMRQLLDRPLGAYAMLVSCRRDRPGHQLTEVTRPRVALRRRKAQPLPYSAGIPRKPRALSPGTSTARDTVIRNVPTCSVQRVAIARPTLALAYCNSSSPG